MLQSNCVTCSILSSILSLDQNLVSNNAEYFSTQTIQAFKRKRKKISSSFYEEYKQIATNM